MGSKLNIYSGGCIEWNFCQMLIKACAILSCQHWYLSIKSWGFILSFPFLHNFPAFQCLCTLSFVKPLSLFSHTNWHASSQFWPLVHKFAYSALIKTSSLEQNKINFKVQLGRLISWKLRRLPWRQETFPQISLRQVHVLCLLDTQNKGRHRTSKRTWMMLYY